MRNLIGGPRRRNGKPFGCLSDVELVCRKMVQRFGQHRWIVDMVRADRQLPRCDVRKPNFTGFKGNRFPAIWIRVTADGQRQIYTKPFDRGLPVLVLAPFFTGLPCHTGREMGNHDRGFNFIAVLPARSAPPCPLDRTVFEKFLDRQTSGVERLIQNGFQTVQKCLDRDRFRDAVMAVWI